MGLMVLPRRLRLVSMRLLVVIRVLVLWRYCSWTLRRSFRLRALLRAVGSLINLLLIMNLFWSLLNLMNSGVLLWSRRR